MALITSGSIRDFSVELQTPSAGAPEIENFAVLAEVSRGVPANTFAALVSPETRGLGLQSLRLDEGFQGFLTRLLGRDTDIYFLAWAWDLSGQPVAFYPGKVTDKTTCLIPLKGGQSREFIGQGVALFPPRRVAAGIALRIQIWESKKGIRDFGEAMDSVARNIQESKINSVLQLVAMGTGVTGATVTLVEEASLELAKIVGAVLKTVGDDYVDFYEGYFPASQSWSRSNMPYRGTASEIVLSRFS
jgi:hypothetical protein